MSQAALLLFERDIDVIIVDQVRVLSLCQFAPVVKSRSSR